MLEPDVECMEVWQGDVLAGYAIKSWNGWNVWQYKPPSTLEEVGRGLEDKEAALKYFMDVQAWAEYRKTHK